MRSCRRPCTSLRRRCLTSPPHLRQTGEDDDPATYLLEIGPDGRRIRPIEVAADGTSIKSDAEDWLFNPPLVDLYDPYLPGQEIHRDEFERAWATAQRLEED